MAQLAPAVCPKTKPRRASVQTGGCGVASGTVGLLDAIGCNGTLVMGMASSRWASPYRSDDLAGCEAAGEQQQFQRPCRRLRALARFGRRSLAAPATAWPARRPASALPSPCPWAAGKALHGLLPHYRLLTGPGGMLALG